MDFLFFDTAGDRLFVRGDAESATWSVEELSLQALFPFNARKVIRRGQRIGFIDDANNYQVFEVRKVRTYEPDHYQELTAEHIVVSELSDEHLYKLELTDVTAGVALTEILDGTLWSVGINTAIGASPGTSSVDISTGSVWQGVREIEQNWNVYITPRVTVNASGITHRYLDIAPAEPVWRGMLLSLDKNADEMGITWDDTNVITAIYGYGGRVPDASGDDTEVLTFADVVWTTAGGDPADKPANQVYVEDPTAKALYGRNGRNRFGYYQNSNIDDAETLLEKSWEVLQTSNTPEVSIDCQVIDLYRLGYADEPIRLHDEAIIDIRPTGEMRRNEITRLTVDLLNPTATRVTIGAYIPNIVYIQRDIEKAAKGGGGGGGRGGGGRGGGQDNQWYEYTTSIQANQYLISLNATHWANTNDILTQAGLSIDAQGVLVYATDNPNMWQSRLNVQADRIGLVVEGSGEHAYIKAASIVASINDSGSQVMISANKIIMDGDVTVQGALNTEKARMDNLLSGNVSASTLRTSSLYVGGSGGGSMHYMGMTVGLYSVVDTAGTTRNVLGVHS